MTNQHFCERCNAFQPSPVSDERHKKAKLRLRITKFHGPRYGVEEGIVVTHYLKQLVGDDMPSTWTLKNLMGKLGYVSATHSARFRGPLSHWYYRPDLFGGVQPSVALAREYLERRSCE